MTNIYRTRRRDQPAARVFPIRRPRRRWISHRQRTRPSIDADGLTAKGEGFDECGATTGVGSSMRSPGFVKAWAARTIEALFRSAVSCSVPATGRLPRLSTATCVPFFLQRPDNCLADKVGSTNHQNVLHGACNSLDDGATTSNKQSRSSLILSTTRDAPAQRRRSAR